MIKQVRLVWSLLTDRECFKKRADPKLKFARVEGEVLAGDVVLKALSYRVSGHTLPLWIHS